MIGFLIFSLCAVRPYKFDISMIDQTFSSEFITHPTETQPVFDPLVPNKKERFWDPGGFLSEKKHGNKNLERTLGCQFVSCRTQRFEILSKEISPQELQKTQIEEDAKGLRVENQSLREQLANEQRTLSQSSLVIGKPWETDKLVFSVWTCF